MTEQEVVRQVVELLDSVAAPYLVVGAIACALYSIPRFTRDADVVVSLSSADLAQLLDRLPPEYEVDAQARLELFTATTRWVVEHRPTLLRIEFFLLGADPHHLEEFARRRRAWLPLIETEAWVATAEDLIVQKLRWARSKDLDDVRNILAVKGKSLDEQYISRWCETHRTLDRLQKIRDGLPEDVG